MRRYFLFLILLLLVSCSKQDCQVGPNITMQQKDPVIIKGDGSNKNETKSLLDQIHDLRDNVQPGAQLRCNF
jgi:hypothetical protein